MMDGTKYREKLNGRKIALAVEILLTLCIALMVVAVGLSNLADEAAQFATEAEVDYDALFSSYTTTFRLITGQIKAKIAQNLTFDEMNQWLQSMDDVFRRQVGGEVYDGISLTYKGGYAHSWSYGDYSAYDPNTRPWYQQAQAANGDIVVVAPYVTYLDPAYLSDDEYILMTIAQKYNEEISFDYDLKINDIRKLLATRGFQYKESQVIFYDDEGYILSSNVEEQFAHNICVPDAVISESLSHHVTGDQARLERLDFAVVDGRWRLLYSSRDANGSTLCILYSFWEVVIHNFSMITLVAVLLFLFELYMYRRNRETILEFQHRDERLTAVTSAAFQNRLYVDLEEMTFYGSEEAKNICPDKSYRELYAFFLNRVPSPEQKETFADFVSPEALRLASGNMYKMVARRFEMIWQKEDGSYKPSTVEVSRLASVIDGRETVGILARDVSEDAEILKAALQQAEQASQAKGVFLSRMSHEIRTPLNAIIGYLDIAGEERNDGEKVAHCLEKAQIASKHLLSIINDVLDVSSIESGRMKLAHDDFDLKQMVNALTTLFYAQAKAKGVGFEVHVDSLESEWLAGDELRVRQVLLNLLSNAVKFTPAGGYIYLNIKQLDNVGQKTRLSFQVRDTGIGMSEEYRARMFTPFEQENASIAKNYGGTGLGLSISNSLVRMMGGTISVESEPGKGTAFTVLLAFDPAKTQDKDHLATESFSSVRALVVDDEEDTCEYVRRLLNRCGVKCDAVTSGKKAVRRVENRLASNHPYDLCIIDWNMEGMDGLETARQLRKLCGEDMPIIIATAYDYSAIEDEARAAGVNKIVSKPLFQSTLFNLLVNTYGKYEPAPPKEKRRIDFHGMRLLLAEDNEMNMEIALDILQKAGLAITPVTNGKEALDAFQNSAPGFYHAILLDIQMPVMDGYEAARAIRKSAHPEASTIPIIAMTANAFTEDVTAALAAGMNDHIAKPISYERLFDALGRLTGEEGTKP